MTRSGVIGPIPRDQSKFTSLPGMNALETMNVGFGRTSLVVAASDGPGG